MGKRIHRRENFLILVGLAVAITGCAGLDEGIRLPGATTRSSGGGGARLPAGPAVVLQGASARPGGSAKLVAKLSAGGKSIAGTQNDIVFSGAVRVAADSRGKPACKVNSRIDKSATAFAFTPSGCKGSACRGVRAIVLAMNNTKPIAHGSVLYTCTVAVGSNAKPGTYELGNRKVGLSTPQGKAVAGSGVAATVTVQ